MKGLELSFEFYKTCGEPMLREQFPDCLDKIAVGLCGSGSECFGFDDEISQDHDFEPGFCIFLPGEDVIDRSVSFRMERAYAKLPREFGGFQRHILSPVGGNRHGVLRRGDFFASKCGDGEGNLTLWQWMQVPESALGEAVNGQVFYDGDGAFSAVRKRLGAFPEDVRRKKLAGCLLLMEQSGQYNYPRCLARGETGAAQLAVFEFAQSAIHCLYLLRGRYMPYYKWAFRGLVDWPAAKEISEALAYLISTENHPKAAEIKKEKIEQIAAAIARMLRAEGLSENAENDLEIHAYAVNKTVEDSDLRNAHILAGV